MINKVKLVQLHEPLFLAGTNMGMKITPRAGLELTHNTDTDHVLVDYKGERAHVKNWASFNEETGAVKVVPQVVTMPNPNVKAQVSGPGIGLKSAQVETPMDKVQGKPGRKAKYQGEEVNE